MITTNIRKVTTLGDLKDHKPIFLTKQDPIDRIDMIPQVWENKEFGNKKHKEKLLGKLLNGYRNEEQKSIPKDSIFLWIFQPFKNK